ncbi:M17 family peptidase N-terminal domain-containing protein, partial [Sinorhizobium meliloti]
MPMKFEFSFSKSHRPAGGAAVLLQVAGAKEAAGAAVVDPEGVLAKAAKIGKFTGKALSTLDVIAPHGSPADRIVLLGLGDAGGVGDHDWLKAGGAAAAKLRSAE